jgi:Protein of unknown function (DUF3237)
LQFTHEGLTLWYGTDDAPSPVSQVSLRQDISITVGVNPPSASNVVSVRYRVNGGIVRTLSARRTTTDYICAKQYFCATFPDFLDGDRVEYLVTLFCDGRQVPDLAIARTFPSTFQLKHSLEIERETQLRTDKYQDSLQSSDQAKFAFNLEYLCTVNVQLDPVPEIIGETPQGLKVNWYVKGGSFSGSKLSGKVLPVGGDWMTIRRDGIGDVGVRATFETDDGALLYLTTTGAFELGTDGYQNFLARNWPSLPTVRSSPSFSTAHPAYLWLNRLQCIGVGEVNMKKLLVTYDVHAVQ